MDNKKIVKLPGKKKKSNVFLGAFILLVSTIIILLFSPIFNILHIEVKGLYRLKENNVIEQSGIVIGQNILKLNKKEIKASLCQNSYIENAEIRRGWPDTIIITVFEKEPVAKIKFVGSDILIDEKAYVLEVSTEGKEIDIPLIDGVVLNSIKVNEKVTTDNDEMLKKFLEVLKGFKNNDMLNDIEKIIDNDGIYVYLKVGHVAKLKNVNNLEYKISLLKEIVQREQNKALIDISDEEKPITKPLWGNI